MMLVLRVTCKAIFPAPEALTYVDNPLGSIYLDTTVRGILIGSLEGLKGSSRNTTRIQTQAEHSI